MKIQANTTMYTRSIGDHNCIFQLVVHSRTEKSAIVTIDRETKRTKIYRSTDGTEYLRPYSFSMAPIFRADDSLNA